MKLSKLLLCVAAASVFLSGVVVGWRLTQNQVKNCEESFADQLYHQNVMLLAFNKQIVDAIDRGDGESLEARARTYLSVVGKQYPGWEKYLNDRFPENPLFQGSESAIADE